VCLTALYWKVNVGANKDITQQGSRLSLKRVGAQVIRLVSELSWPKNQIFVYFVCLHLVGSSYSFCIGSLPVKSNPVEFRVWSGAGCTVKVYGWYIRVMKYLGA